MSAYQAALAYSTDLVDARAATQNNLGTAHWNLAQYTHPARNLKAAIAAYTEALAFYHRIPMPSATPCYKTTWARHTGIWQAMRIQKHICRLPSVPTALP
ncbi:MAG: hypothetical protein HC925_00275 [Coleofasciculaceae cyanobacterium SM2_3_26]|nr:hypothetical protein [Coleofasciculaceae cyanobacterium SM2_3_26]